MSSKVAADFFGKGLEALRNGHLYLARVCFENACNEERSPTYCSYFARTLAESRGEFDEAIALAEEARNAEPENSVHYLNLGRIYLAAGRKTEAVEALRAGAAMDRNSDILLELEHLGLRGRPVFPGLPRNHFLNKYVGIFLARLGMRKG